MVMEQTRHYKLATSTLKDVEIYARYYGFTVKDDWGSPFHILLDFEIQGQMKWSVYCSGFDKRLDLQKMTNNWHIDKRFEERSFGGVKSLMRYLNNRKPKELGGKG